MIKLTGKFLCVLWIFVYFLGRHLKEKRGKFLLVWKGMKCAALDIKMPLIKV